MLVFFAGQTGGAPDRRLHPEGQLGLAPPPLSETQPDTDAAYADALQVLHDIQEARADGVLHLPEPTLLEMLSTPARQHPTA